MKVGVKNQVVRKKANKYTAIRYIHKTTSKLSCWACHPQGSRHCVVSKELYNQ